MATVTGLTAPRMLQIEAASIVDGDVIGGNLILTKHDGTQINAGPVVGPQGPQGPMGAPTPVLNATPVLEVGMVNQIKAGRQLALADFTNLGLSAPIGLWNLSDLTDGSGNARSLNNKGAVPFTTGINGVANTAMQFAGAGTQALYISDTGVNDPFKIKTGSFGCWLRTAKRGTVCDVMSKRTLSAGGYGYAIEINSNNVATTWMSTNGTDTPVAVGSSDVCDDKWHFIVASSDGGSIRLYVDGVLESITAVAGIIFGSNGPFNIGASVADGSTAANVPHFGRVDEAFITTDVFSDEEVRNLYCAKIAHGLSTTPTRASINVRRRRKGSALSAADFPAQPLRLHNFSGASLGDEGSGGIALTNNAAAPSVVGADGTVGNAFSFLIASAQSLSSTDAGLPAALATRSYGCWLKTAIGTSGLGMGVLGWGTLGTGDSRIIVTSGNISTTNGADQIIGPPGSDGQWHFVVVVEDNAPIDGVKRKLYIDGHVAGGSTALTGIVLAGVNRFRIGANPDNSNPFTGQVDGAFVCGYALTSDQIAALYAKGSQVLFPSPKDSGDHVEGITAANLFCTFDTLDSQHQIDLAVT